MIVPFKVDEDYIKTKIKKPFLIKESNTIADGFQFLVNKDNLFCGYIRVYLKKDGTTNIDFSQIKAFRLEIEELVLGKTNCISKPQEVTKIENMCYTQHKSSIGIDESGKGDLFGPLVIVSAYVPENNFLIAKLIKNGIKDSKLISDKEILELSDLINAQNDIYLSQVIISPKRYNELYSKMKNLNKLLAWGHATAVETLLNELEIEQIECKKVVSDQFENNNLLETNLININKDINLIKIPKAESCNLSVAVASIIARALFLKEMKQLSEELKCIVPKGADYNATNLAIKLKSEVGVNNLCNYVKMHFKNVKEIVIE